MGTFNDVSNVFSEIASALRLKANTLNNYRPNEIASNINALETVDGGSLPMGDVSGIKWSVKNTWNTWNADDLFKDNEEELSKFDEIIFSSNVQRACNCFYNCRNMNKRVTFSSSMRLINSMFYNCHNFNQPVNLSSIKSYNSIFYNCFSFNQAIKDFTSAPGIMSSYYHNGQYDDEWIPYTDGFYRTFYRCYNFNQPMNFLINNSDFYLNGTFMSCSNFNSPVTFKYSPICMTQAFQWCENFNQPVDIFNIYDSTASADYSQAFYSCYKFNQPLTISNNISNLAAFLALCYNFKQNINIPNFRAASVNMSAAFMYCVSFNNATRINIHNNVTDMAQCFEGCESLNCQVTLSNNGGNAYRMFAECHNFNASITIPSAAKIYNMAEMFINCNNFSQAVTIPLYAENMSHMLDGTNYSTTFYFNNSIIDASYIVANHKLNIVKAGPTSNFYSSKNLRNIQGFYRNGYNFSTLTVSYFSTATNLRDVSYMFDNCFNLLSISSLSSMSWNVENVSHMFSNCFNLNVTSLSYYVNTNLKDMSYMFYQCQNYNYSAVLYIPNTVTNISHMMYNCGKFNQLLSNTINVENVIDASYAFYNVGAAYDTVLRRQQSSNIIFDFANVENMAGFFKNCQIFWNYGYSLTSWYPPTFYIGQNIENLSEAFYNMGMPCYNVSNVATDCKLRIRLRYTQKLKNLYRAFTTKVGCNAFQVSIEGNGGFNNLQNIEDCGKGIEWNLNPIDLRYSSINSIAKAFYYPRSHLNDTTHDYDKTDIYFNIYNIINMEEAFVSFTTLNSISEMQPSYPNINSLYNTFCYCYNFNQPIVIPNSVINMVNTFYSCNNFNQPITIPNNVTNMRGTFYNCRKFNSIVTFEGNNVTNMVGTFELCSNFNQPIVIPNSATELTGTFRFCTSFDQPITIPNSVINMAQTFYGCDNFNQPIVIPENVKNMYKTFSNDSGWGVATNVKQIYFKNSSNLINCKNMHGNYQDVRIYCSNASPFLSLLSFTYVDVPDGNSYYENAANNCRIYLNYPNYSYIDIPN